MYKKLYKTFYYETFSYHLLSPKQTVVDQLDAIFTANKGILQSPNLGGKFVEYPDTFFMTQKWWLGHITNFEKEPAILKGVITKKNDNETVIEIAVRPNSVYLILFLCFLSFGLYSLYNATVTKERNETLVGFWILAIVLPSLFLLARWTSNKLRKSFEKRLNITPNN